MLGLHFVQLTHECCNSFQSRLVSQCNKSFYSIQMRFNGFTTEMGHVKQQQIDLRIFLILSNSA